MIEYTYPPQTQPKKNVVGVAVVLAGIMLLLVAVVALIFINPFHHGDSGVAACRQLTSATKTDTAGPMTKDDYHKARAPFEHTKFADLKIAGTAVVDTVYKLDQESDQTNNEDLGAAMADLNLLTTQWATLQTACKNHGVDNVPDIT